MGFLTTHVLDTHAGRPARAVAISLYRIEQGKRQELLHVVTNADGRCDEPLLDGESFRGGVYELLFEVGAYFRRHAVNVGEPPFLDVVPIRFGVSRPDQHYHVPLLVTPWSYSTYRGS